MLTIVLSRNVRNSNVHRMASATGLPPPSGAVTPVMRYLLRSSDFRAIPVNDFQQRRLGGVGLARQVFDAGPRVRQSLAGDAVMMTAQQQVYRMPSLRGRRHDHPYHGMRRTAARTVFIPGCRVWQQVVLRRPAESRRALVGGC
jgi:hypothetical protein